MADGTVQVQSLSDLLDLAGDDSFDWDPGALADWPNIAPGASSAPGFPASMPDEGLHAS